MAKKKGGNKGGPKPAAESSNPALEQENSSSNVAAEPSETSVAAEPSPRSNEAQSAPAVSSGEDSEALRQQLQEKDAEIARQKAELAAQREEIARLKSQLANSGSTGSAAVTTDTGKHSDQLEHLQQRIASLKAEQAEADAAREQAWRQLKSVVSDIARLAAPDAMMKAGTPTAANAVA
ncbi:hypothetical protein HYH03_012327 [Edaphochlamys debaryana]|uniref:Uncharacterized protein n=1 Tax=Edaphochlamys debaryana TaxID=47281 RepID=A0A836BU22_9CHLO|nr:hypothetical protein HYH03_012327 [Edaphochlamys debaryana]|eukprot:KAG2489101.1 hypothetical protein HYH03_012327 [Edaphochlamys debaryana]